MTDADDQQFNSLAERIAALHKQQSFQNIGAGATADSPRKRAPPPPPPPPRTQTAPALTTTAASTHQTPPQLPQRPTNGSNHRHGPPPLPRRDTQGSAPISNEQSRQESGRPKPPPLPSRSATFQPSPQLPPRRSSTQPTNALSARRNSASSEASLQSSISSLSLTKTASSTTSPGSNGPSQRKLPPVYDVATLPPLPVTKRELQAQAKEIAAREEAAAAAAREEVARESAWQTQTRQQAELTASSKPSLPPRLPSRPATTTGTQPAVDLVKARKHGQATDYGVAPRVPQRSKLDDDDAPPPPPPPVPVASRPSLAQIQAVASRPPPRAQTQTTCWACRDWSGPDAVASQCPRESLPQNDPIGYLAQGLCGPFPSYTDKARAIFTWFHHNIYYDTEAFFGGRVGHQTPDRTIFTGRAVCAGYAETYKAIAMRAGLECVVVGGHGKGFGYTALKKGERPPPPKPDGHAWNAVRVDGGDWKLIDACWGAGHVDGASKSYNKAFHPAEFTAPNDIFGRKHFPEDSRYQFRNDGRVISWEEYYIGPINEEPVEFFGGGAEEGIAEHSVRPMERQISVHSGQVVRFQFSKVCEHWTSEKNGRGKTPLFLLHMPGAVGPAQNLIPMETDGYWNWLDVDARHLGPPGQSVFVAYLTSFDGKEGQEARAVTKQEFLSKRGRVGMGWDYLMRWMLV